MSEKTAHVRTAYQIMGRSIGIHPQLAGDAVEVTAHLTPIIEKAGEIDEEEFEEFQQDFQEFLEAEQEKGIDSRVIPFTLWLALLPKTKQEKQAEQTPDPMFR